MGLLRNKHCVVDEPKLNTFLSNKSAQLQIQETIIAIFIFIIIIVIGMSLFFRFQENNIQQEARSFAFEQLGNSILSLPDTSEFVYTENGNKLSIIDTTKLLALKSLTNKRKDYYFERFGYKNITIIEVYPESDKTKECTEGSFYNCNIWSIYYHLPEKYQLTTPSEIPKFRKETPISLYDPLTETFTIGVLIVEEYSL